MERFPQYLNSPLQVLWFESDELAIIFCFFLFGLLYGLIFFAAMIVIPYFYSKAKKKYARGFFRHSLWLVGLAKIEGYPDYFEREFSE